MTAPGIPRSLFVFALLYGGMVCIAGVLGAKQVAIGPLAVEAGILAFLLLVVLASAVSELHGGDTANRLVRFGFLPLIVSMILIRVVIALPAAPAMDAGRLSAFETTLGQGARLMLAGLISYGISQTLNVTLF
ncbi:MAG: VUT family protein, partial [Sphingomonadaceae bacterium]|nr:VUT family protein [Sphingomonadaceae bacterium]